MDNMHTTPSVPTEPAARPNFPAARTAAWQAGRRRAVRRAADRAVELLEPRQLFAVTGVNDASWVQAGPTALTESSLPGTQTITGSINGIATDPADANTYYVATAGGGIWKTTNGGTTWAAQIDGQPTLSIGAIAISPSNPNVVYAGTGTGDSDVDSTYGQGIYRTENGGATWQLLATTQFARQAFEKIVVDPNDPGTLYAAVNNGQPYGQPLVTGTTATGAAAAHPTGIYKSTDGGVTWTDTTTGFTTDDYFYDLAIDTTTPSVLYCTTRSETNGQGGVYKTFDAGLTWNMTAAFPTPTFSFGLGGNTAVAGGTDAFGFASDATQFTNQNYGRIAIAIAPDQPGTIYASISFNQGDGETDVAGGDSTDPFAIFDSDVEPGFVLRSIDGGDSWTEITGAPVYSEDATFSNQVIIDPANPATFYLGGSVTGTDTAGNFTDEVFRGDFSGAAFTDLTVGTSGTNGVGDDVKQFAFDADARLIAVTDEGIWRLDAPTSGTITWTNLNGNIDALRTRTVSLSPTASDAITAAAEFNGVVARAGTGASTQAWNQLYALENVRDVIVDPRPTRPSSTPRPTTSRSPRAPSPTGPGPRSRASSTRAQTAGPPSPRAGPASSPPRPTTPSTSTTCWRSTRTIRTDCCWPSARRCTSRPTRRRPGRPFTRSRPT